MSVDSPQAIKVLTDLCLSCQKQELLNSGTAMIGKHILT